jgi:hypothetical protein
MRFLALFDSCRVLGRSPKLLSRWQEWVTTQQSIWVIYHCYYSVKSKPATSSQIPSDNVKESRRLWNPTELREKRVAALNRH